MANLIYYRTERDNFPQAYAEILSDSKAEMFFGKLQSHYKIRHYITFGGRRLGVCNQNSIKLKRGQASVGILAHEVAHAIQFKKFNYTIPKGTRFHTKQHTNIMRKVIEFIDNHKANWVEVADKKHQKWIDGQMNKIKKNEELKHLKTTDEYKLNKALNKQARLLSKEKRISNLLKKIQKQIKYYERKKLNRKI